LLARFEYSIEVFFQFGLSLDELANYKRYRLSRLFLNLDYNLAYYGIQWMKANAKNNYF
tara:strand:- start:34983 stop:35159 length:177 start_codon:yes stop_codon:yes gene_type:complete